jgi:hypothetical protein
VPAKARDSVKTTMAAIVIAILCCHVDAAGQSLRLGAKGGLVRASWTGEFGTPSSPFSARTGLIAGASLSLQLIDFAGIQVEAQYVQKGASSGNDFRATVGYAELPLLVRLAVPLDPSTIRPIALVGLAPALEIACSVRARPGNIPEAPPLPPQRMDCIEWRNRKRDVGVILAAGIETRSMPASLTAEIRRTSGRKNIIVGYERVRMFNNVWSIVVGATYAFPK